MTEDTRASTTPDQDLPTFPMPRDARCPFDPPPEGLAAQHRERFSRVKLWNGRTYWMVTHYADQRTLLSDPRLSADIRNPAYPAQAEVDREGGEFGLPLLDDPEHARLRRLVTAPFAVKRIAAMRPAVQQIADDLIDTMLAGPKPVDLVDAFALPLPSLVICELLGVAYADHDFFQDHSKTIVNRAASAEANAAAIAELGAFLARLLESKIVEPADDLLSELGRHVTAGELTMPQAVQMGILLLIGGHETTANMIALGTLALLEHPDQLALLRDNDDDPAVVASAVEELLRYLTVLHDGRRRAVLEDVELDGHIFKAGEGIIFPNELANRDEGAFTDGHRLDLKRNARHHVAFGFGVHQCLGQPLARMELQVVYSTLYRRIPTLALAVDIDDLRFKHEGSVYGVYELPLTW